jgi:NAD(P)-dependent dehydrogenase (short-subunit alcohol dehydrogenase family)
MTHPLQQPLRAAVTGGTSGLGRALVAELLRRGARVAFVARHTDEVRRTAQDLRGSHGIVGDVSRKDDIYPLALQITGILGGLDVLVNNASSLGPVPLALLADTDCEDLELALATNVVGPFRLTKALLGSPFFISDASGTPNCAARVCKSSRSIRETWIRRCMSSPFRAPTATR